MFEHTFVSTWIKDTFVRKFQIKLKKILYFHANIKAASIHKIFETNSSFHVK